MRKLTLVLIVLAVVIISTFLAFYPSMISTTGNAVSVGDRRQAAGIAVAASLAVIFLVGYLTSRNK